ncbi:NADPH2:quinone reductase [Hamadaea flava]|uniref:NADPH:quinone oxidoreductase family protein n=1 Tax=Hamadaea flava TaxID=1742688 RepID=A0ABV8LID3_9ACTN|nr:NADPH:quinone oxidoreductase family protein [Hamadaea flava]MCP2325302.1 NADPH2:quinone reductase [Hamadaea flava]
MRAWQVTRLGEPADALDLVDVPEPQPGPGQLAVRVRASALNFPDVLLCRGHYQVRPPLPFTPGVELCGEVIAVGEGVDRQVGERIIGTPALPTGGLAEVAILDAVDAFPAPESLTDAEAAALHIAYQTGFVALHRRAQLQTGETLLVHAAAGGVGSAAVQLGKAAGARVIAVVGGPAKAEVATKLGADLVIDRREQDFVAVVKEATGGRGADVVYDPVGGDAYAGSARCVAFEGRILVIGFAGGTVPAPPLNHALIKNYSIVGVHWGLYRQLDPAVVSQAHRALLDLAATGAIRPLVSEVLPLAAAVDGLTRLGAGDTVGRVVITP